MIISIILDAVYINDTDKEGNRLKNKNSRSYKNVVIKYDSHTRTMYCDDEWHKDKLSICQEWKKGDRVIIKKIDNGDYKNFDIPNKTDMLEAKVLSQGRDIKRIKDHLGID